MPAAPGAAAPGADARSPARADDFRKPGQSGKLDQNFMRNVLIVYRALFS
jgi:hypothetical protein